MHLLVDNEPRACLLAIAKLYVDIPEEIPRAIIPFAAHHHARPNEIRDILIALASRLSLPDIVLPEEEITSLLAGTKHIDCDALRIQERAVVQSNMCCACPDSDMFMNSNVEQEAIILAYCIKELMCGQNKLTTAILQNGAGLVFRSYAAVSLGDEPLYKDLHRMIFEYVRNNPDNLPSTAPPLFERLKREYAVLRMRHDTPEEILNLYRIIDSGVTFDDAAGAYHEITGISVRRRKKKAGAKSSADKISQEPSEQPEIEQDSSSADFDADSLFVDFDVAYARMNPEVVSENTVPLTNTEQVTSDFSCVNDSDAVLPVPDPIVPDESSREAVPVEEVTPDVIPSEDLEPLFEEDIPQTEAAPDAEDESGDPDEELPKNSLASRAKQVRHNPRACDRGFYDDQNQLTLPLCCVDTYTGRELADGDLPGLLNPWAVDPSGITPLAMDPIQFAFSLESESLLSIEYAIMEGVEGLLVYLSALKQIVFVSSKDTSHFPVLMSFMSRKSSKKVSMFGAPIYDLCFRNKHTDVVALHSLREFMYVHMQTSDTGVLSLRDCIEYVNHEATSLCELLPRYAELYRRITKCLTKEQLHVVEQRECFSLAAGASCYTYEINRDRLPRISHDGKQYLFKPLVESSLKIGFLLSVELMGDEDYTSVFRAAVSDLCRSKDFYLKYLVVGEITKSLLTLYVPVHHYNELHPVLHRLVKRRLVASSLPMCDINIYTKIY